MYFLVVKLLHLLWAYFYPIHFLLSILSIVIFLRDLELPKGNLQQSIQCFSAVYCLRQGTKDAKEGVQRQNNIRGSLLDETKGPNRLASQKHHDHQLVTITYFATHSPKVQSLSPIPAPRTPTLKYLLHKSSLPSAHPPLCWPKSVSTSYQPLEPRVRRGYQMWRGKQSSLCQHFLLTGFTACLWHPGCLGHSILPLEPSPAVTET